MPKGPKPKPKGKPKGQGRAALEKAAKAAASAVAVWAQCDNAGCQKWRKLPPGSKIDEDNPWCAAGPSCGRPAAPSCASAAGA